MQFKMEMLESMLYTNRILRNVKKRYGMPKRVCVSTRFGVECDVIAFEGIEVSNEDLHGFCVTSRNYEMLDAIDTDACLTLVTSNTALLDSLFDITEYVKEMQL